MARRRRRPPPLACIGEVSYDRAHAPITDSPSERVEGAGLRADEADGVEAELGQPQHGCQPEAGVGAGHEHG